MDGTPRPNSAAETLDCPHCGAAVTYSRGATSVRCSACGRAVPIPGAPRVVVARTVLPAAGQGGKAISRPLVIGCLASLVVIAAILVLMIVTATPSAQPAAPVSTAEPTRVPPTKTPTLTPTPPALETLLSFGQKGMGVGQFEDANVIVPDNAGHLYVSERHGGRIQVFDEAGQFLTQWFVANPKPQTLITSLAADGQGHLFVATDDEILTRYEGATGRLLNQLPYAGGPGFTKIALMPNGGLAALHSIDSGIATAPHEGVQDDLVIFDAQGAVTHVITEVVSGQTDEAEINLQLAVDRHNNIYVLGTYYTHEIYKFSPEGKFITRIGDPDELRGAYSLAIDSQDRLYADGYETILVYDNTGRRVAAFAPGTSTYSLVFDAHDNLWVISDNTAVKKLKLLPH